MKEDKPIASLNIYKIEDGSDEDYRIVATARTGGLSFEFDRTVSQIREYFTERREKKEAESEGQEQEES